MSGTKLKWLGGTAAVLALFAAFAVFEGPHSCAVAQDAATTDVARDEAQSDAVVTAHALSKAFASAAERVKPSVVNITSARRGSNSVVRGPSMQPFHEFFGGNFFERFRLVPPDRGRDFVQRGQGSGVILEDGYILTNNHVVEDADEVTVRLLDERTLTAEVVGTDPHTDLAVLRVEADELVPAKLGDSDQLHVGEWVVAAGNPFGLASSMTAGIVSATGRANVGIADYEDFIQTDAAINPGNSGGPLVNLDGAVVGINTAIFSRSGGYMGIGFAIPINMARSIMTSLIEDGRVARGWLGVNIQRLEPGLARSFGYEGKGGVLIGDVSPTSPADDAGLRAGDIVARFDGKEVASIERFRSQVAATKPGSKVDVEVFRDGSDKLLQVQLGELESNLASVEGTDKPALALGMSVRTLTPDLAQRLGRDGVEEGVLVTQVDPIGAAARAGLRVNDLIVAIGETKVTDVQDFRKRLSKANLDEGVRLTVEGETSQRFAFLRSTRPVG